MKPGARPLHEWTATEIVAAVISGKTTCEAVARACLERIAAREPKVHAWKYLDGEQVIEQARVLDRSGPRGPLAGVPVGVKDIIDTCDMPTEYGTIIHQGHQPPYDASCVALSRKAGAVLMGKTVTTEFANVTPGPTRNPHDTTRTPGGSSSGSAAAVADYMVPLALGTQTTGSTTRPASFCGVIGYRPTYGDLRTSRVMEAAGSFDTLGLIARSLEDIALYRDVLLGVAPQPIAADAPVPRIGFCRTYFWPRLESATQHLLEGAAETLRRAGAAVDDVDLPPDWEQLEAAHRTISGFEFVRNFAWEIQNHWEEISGKLRESRIKDGLACSYGEYHRMRTLVEWLRQELDPVMDRYDVLLAPAAVGEAPGGSNPIPHGYVYMGWTCMHVPSITLPVFRGPQGLPIGAQLIAKRGDDRRLFSASQWAWRQLT